MASRRSLMSLDGFDLSRLLSECEKTTGTTEHHYNLWKDSGNLRHRDAVVLLNIRLIVKEAWVRATSSVTLSDLVQEGSIGFACSLNDERIVGASIKQKVVRAGMNCAIKHMRDYIQEHSLLIYVPSNSHRYIGKEDELTKSKVIEYHVDNFPIEFVMLPEKMGCRGGRTMYKFEVAGMRIANACRASVRPDNIEDEVEYKTDDNNTEWSLNKINSYFDKRNTSTTVRKLVCSYYGIGGDFKQLAEDSGLGLKNASALVRRVVSGMRN